MSVTLAKGKVIINDETITIKKFMGSSTVIQKRRITNISKYGSIFHGIWMCCWILPLPKGIKMLSGQRIIQVETTGDNYEFWLPKGEYSTLQSHL